MNGFGRRDATMHRPQSSRAGRRLSDRLADAFSGHAPALAAGRDDDYSEHALDLEGTFQEDEVLARFPIARQGYDCQSVDEYLAELESAFMDTQREVAALRGQVPARSEVAAEIERLGEQTSAILITAHDKANETITLAQAQAQTCIADAASYAAALREEAEIERRRAETETAVLHRERDRLLGDMQSTAAALSSLAANAAGR